MTYSPLEAEWLDERIEQVTRAWRPERVEHARRLISDILGLPPVPYAQADADRAPRLYVIAERDAPAGTFLKVGKTTQPLGSRLRQHLGGTGVRGGAIQGGRMLALYMAHEHISDAVQAEGFMLRNCVVYWTRSPISPNELHEAETIVRTVLRPLLGQ